MATSSDSTAYPFIEPVVLAKWILEKEEIWQERFREPDEFARFCSDRGISLQDETVRRLWQLGLLRADLVVSTIPIRKSGLIPVGKIGKRQYAYADARPTKDYPAGLAAAASKLRTLQSSTKLFFHPFRFCVICQYEKLSHFFPRPTPLTSLSSFQVLQKHFDNFQERCGSANFLHSFVKVNIIALLAIATEPCMYPRIFHRWRFRSLDEKTHRKHVDDLWSQIEKIYTDIGEKSLGEAWEMLNHYSSDLEPNLGLQNVLRLAPSEVRATKLKGQLAGAMFLRTTAEVIRRAAEAVFGTKWNEEGETWDSKRGKRDLYGSERIFDGDKSIADRVIRHFWPSVGLHVRWYVEGETELGALEYRFGQNPPGIDLVPFGGTASSFLRRHLRNDMKNGIYSFVSFDRSVNDRANYKWFKKAHQDGEFFGVPYISDPDFEFANFSLVELQEILWQMAVENGAAVERREHLLEVTKSCQTAKELEKRAKRLVELARFSKGKEWGRRLMQFADKHPLNKKGEERPVIRALGDGIRGAAGLYNHWVDRSMFRINFESGTLVRK